MAMTKLVRTPSDGSPANPQDVEASTRWMEVLDRVLARMATDQDESHGVRALAQAVVDELGAAWVRIWLYEPADNALQVRASAGLTDIPDHIRAHVSLGAAA